MGKYKYRGKTPVEDGDAVEVAGTAGEWLQCVVQSALASQFSYTDPAGAQHRGYCAYADKGLTWRKV